MNIKFPAVDESYLKSKVESGYYANITEAVRDAVRRMREIDEQGKLAEVRAMLAKGLEQIERGEGVPYTPELFDKLMIEAIEDSKAGKPVRDEVIPKNFKI